MWNRKGDNLFYNEIHVCCLKELSMVMGGNLHCRGPFDGKVIQSMADKWYEELYVWHPNEDYLEIGTQYGDNCCDGFKTWSLEIRNLDVILEFKEESCSWDGPNEDSDTITLEDPTQLLGWVKDTLELMS